MIDKVVWDVLEKEHLLKDCKSDNKNLQSKNNKDYEKLKKLYQTNQLFAIVF